MNTYNKIIYYAFEEFSNHGYNGTSVNNIIKKAQISKGALYHYFKSKEDLFLETINFFSLQMMEELNNELPLTLKDLKKFGLDSLEMYKKNEKIQKFALEIVIQSSRNESVKKRLTDLLSKFMKSFEDLFKHYKQLGIIKKSTDTKLLSQKTFILLDSLGLYLSFGFEIEYEKIWNDFVDNELSKHWKN